MDKQKYMICNSAEDESTIFVDLNEEEQILLETIFDNLNSQRARYAPTITICPMTPKPVMERIWTVAYRPFIMGGNVNEAISTEVTIIERRMINGFNFFTFKTPRGSIKVCDAQTGGVIADSFEELEKNIEGLSKEFLQSQIDGAKERFPNMREMTNEEFFGMYLY
jgi:hypothetical protein